MKRRYIFILTLMIVLIIILSGCEIYHEKISKEDIEDVQEDILEKPQLESISVLAAGDIMFHIPQIDSARIGAGEYDFSPVFKYVKKYIQDTDISIANFETVTVDERKYSGFPRFNSPSASILALKDAGFDILSTANNHCLDQGKQGIISTLKNIEDTGLKSIGTYDSPQIEPMIEKVKGIEIGLLSYTYGVNGLDSLLSREELSYMVNLIDEHKIEEDIAYLKEKDVDIILVFIHWGHEYHREPSNYQVELGNKMIQWGANIIFGSHPHIVQRTEIIEHNGRDNFIIYSMGNFISNQSEHTMGNPYTEDGVMVKIDIEKDLISGQTAIKIIDYIPTWVYRYREEGKMKYAILPVEDVLNGNIGIDLDKTTLLRVEKSYRDTMGTLKDSEVYLSH